MAALKARSLLVLDGIGALAASLMLSQVVMRLQPPFHMPTPILKGLAIVAAAFAAFALGAAWWVRKKVWRFLRIMAYANISYATGTAVLFWLLWPRIGKWDKVYFLFELFLLTLLVVWELRVVQRYVWRHKIKENLL